MKKSMYLLLIFSLLFSGCSPILIEEIGRVNMVSNRNINPNLAYQQLTTYSGGSERELKNSTALSVQDAINQTVKAVPGGEYLMNAKFYMVNKDFFAVEGDVWGFKTQEFRGFKLGNKVIWNGLFKKLSGIIDAFKNDDECTVKEDQTNKLIDVRYEDLTNIYNENAPQQKPAN